MIERAELRSWALRGDPERDREDMGTSNSVDLGRLAEVVREMLLALGEDPGRDGLLRTPERVAVALAELVGGASIDPAHHLDTAFDVDHEGVVAVRDLPFSSLCEHHLLPFSGTVGLAYLPRKGSKVVGLSKLGRLVEGYSRRLQVQERLTHQLAAALSDRLDPEGVLVRVEAEHFCMSMRGVRHREARTITLAARGIYQSDPVLRREVLDLLV